MCVYLTLSKLVQCVWIRCSRDDSIMFGTEWFSECRTELVQARLCSIGLFYSSVSSFKGRQTSSVKEAQSAQCSQFLLSHRWLNPIPIMYNILCSVSVVWVLKDIAPNNDWTYHSLKLFFSNRKRTHFSGQYRTSFLTGFFSHHSCTNSDNLSIKPNISFPAMFQRL